MALPAKWREAGSTRRSHLVMIGSNGRVVNRSCCGMVRLAAWLPESRGCRRCGTCKRIKKHWKVVKDV